MRFKLIFLHEFRSERLFTNGILKRMMHEGTLTSFAFYDQHCTNTAHEQ